MLHAEETMTIHKVDVHYSSETLWLVLIIIISIVLLIIILG